MCRIIRIRNISVFEYTRNLTKCRCTLWYNDLLHYYISKLFNLKTAFYSYITLKIIWCILLLSASVLHCEDEQFLCYYKMNFILVILQQKTYCTRKWIILLIVRKKLLWCYRFIIYHWKYFWFLFFIDNCKIKQNDCKMSFQDYNKI